MGLLTIYPHLFLIAETTHKLIHILQIAFTLQRSVQFVTDVTKPLRVTIAVLWSIS